MHEPADPSLHVTPPSPLETRWPCPVCVGARMDKLRIGERPGVLTLDCCPRCGGLWFDRGEVGELAKHESGAVRKLLPQRSARVRPPCVGCRTPLDRDTERCPVCGTRNVLDCPVCDQTMERRAHDGLVLDFCRRCRGVWFDNAELSAIWRLALAAAANAGSARGGHRSDVLATGGDMLLEAAFWSPDLVVYGGMAAGEVVGHAAGAAGELLGHAAESVFSAVLEIIAGLFDGL